MADEKHIISWHGSFQKEFFDHLDEEKDLDSPEEQVQEAADKTKLLLRYVKSLIFCKVWDNHTF